MQYREAMEGGKREDDQVKQTDKIRQTFISEQVTIDI